MVFREFGNTRCPAIIMLHGGGLSWWSLESSAKALNEQYYVVTPVIDGHGENSDTTFVSIENYAQKLISFIDDKFGGHVYALYGLSIGAQIVTEVLVHRKDIASFAVIESALVFPIKGAASLTIPMTKISYGLIKKRWFAKQQAKALFVPNDQFELYFSDSVKISKQSLLNVTLSNAGYNIKPGISQTHAKALVIAGEKELNIMRKSAKALCDYIPDSTLHIAENMGHGELSLKHIDQFVDLIKQFLSEREIEK